MLVLKNRDLLHYGILHDHGFLLKLLSFILQSRGQFATLIDPLVPVLQIENNHNASHGFLFLCIPYESKFLTVYIKTKTPCGVVVFCLIVELH
jgi:hypothetical protein